MQSSSSGLLDPNKFSPSIFIGVVAVSVVTAGTVGGGETLLVLFFPVLPRRLRDISGVRITLSAEDARSGVLFSDAEAEPVSTLSVSSAYSKGSIRRWMRISRFSQQTKHCMSRSEETSREDLSWPQSGICCCADAMLPRGRSLRPEAMAVGSLFLSRLWGGCFCWSSRVRRAAGGWFGWGLFFALVGELQRFSYPSLLWLEGSF